MEQQAEFEQDLLSYADMCYSVAFALTRNPRQAQDLARYALTSVWRMHRNVESRPAMKQELLKALRNRFLVRYWQPPSSRRKECACGQDTAGTVKDVVVQSP